MIDPPVLQRCRLDPVKMDHFLDFILIPSFLQDVAYGTKNLKLSDGHTIEIPNVVRIVVASRLIRLYQEHCRESEFEPIGRSTLFNILKVRRNSHVLSLSVHKHELSQLSRIYIQLLKTESLNIAILKL